ncbi:MAG: 23S rRNA (adenine(2503)-C(2))-methyltransferase RlmN [Tannerella sp.]|jgi:23S rRNA (adenine2503-C2)-methyltransferase|nr:23S rRNA (adenine(2503)-C(2))-methyltransferase RlmN [Tannerella sp.]
MNVNNRKTRLLGMTLDELKEVAVGVGLPSYAARQLADWLYKKKVTSIGEMTNLAKTKRALLEASYEVGALPPGREMKSIDGTVKYLFRIPPDYAVETVYIPEKERATLCVSSQVGCRMNCLFCMTGKQGFSANLTAGDIINQIQSVPVLEQFTNVVFMGMGEPFDNTDELFNALNIMTSDYGYGWSPKRITVSTIGIMEGLRRFLDESTCHLAVSLHSPYSDERRSLMPIEKAYPAAEIIRLLKQYDFSHQRRVSFEYILFENRNDSPTHAEALARMLRGLECRVNLIRFHTIPGTSLESSSQSRMEQFRDALNMRGITCTIRTSRGEDILAACGMLSTTEKNTPEKSSLYPHKELYL